MDDHSPHLILFQVTAVLAIDMRVERARRDTARDHRAGEDDEKAHNILGDGILDNLREDRRCSHSPKMLSSMRSHASRAEPTNAFGRVVFVSAFALGPEP